MIANLQAQRIGPVREEQFLGRTFKVFPAVLVREGVLNNNLGRTFLSGEVIAGSVSSWNGIPAVIRHPRKGGRPISARSPEVMNATGVGFIYHARYDDSRKALLGDVYIDPERLPQVPDAQNAIGKVERGEPGEVSTGFGTAVEKNPGMHGGLRYDIEMTRVIPDHLAILVEEIGACSLEDGCGLGVNESQPAENACGCTSKEDKSVNDTTNGEEVVQDGSVEDSASSEESQEAVTNDEPLSESDDSPADPPEASGTAEEEPTQNRKLKWHEKLLGFLGFNVSDETRRDLMHEALSSRFGNSTTMTWPLAIYSDEGYVVFEMEGPAGVSLYRTDFSESEGAIELSGDLIEVRKVTMFEPVANAGEDSTPNPQQEGITMNRDELIAQLSERSPLSAETLEKMSDEELGALNEKFPEEAPVQDQATNADEIAERISESVTAAINELREEFAGQITELREAAEPAINEREQERTRLIEALVANDRCVFEQAELENRGLEELRKLSAMAGSAAGRPGPRVAENTEAPQFMEPVHPYANSEEG